MAGIGAAVCGLAGLALFAAGARRSRADSSRVASGENRASRAARGAGAHRAGLLGVAVTLLCAAAAGTSAALHAADVHRGPLPDLAEDYAHTRAEVTVTGDPRATRPQVRGARTSAGVIVIPAEVVRLRTPAAAHTPGAAHTGGTDAARQDSWARLRTPVLLMVVLKSGGPDDGSGAGAGGASRAALRERSAWLRLLPSTGLRVNTRLAPPADDRPGGGDITAVLRIDAGAPHVVRAPTTTQRLAGQLRSGLRKATGGLGADARGLLPGLVVGDTSRLRPELEDAFRATDMTHLTAVSGANLSILLVLLIGPPGLAHSGGAWRAGAAAGAVAAGYGRGRGAAHAGLRGRVPPGTERAAGRSVRPDHDLLAIGTGRRRSLLPALAAAVLLLVFYDPWLARDFGFLLSVLATASLLAWPRRGVRPCGGGGAPAARGGAGRCGGGTGGVRPGGRGAGRACEPRGGAVQSAGGVRGRTRHGAGVRRAGRGTRGDAGGEGAGLAGGLARRRRSPASPAPARAAGGRDRLARRLAGALLLAAALTSCWWRRGRRLSVTAWLCAGCALLLLLAVMRPAPADPAVHGLAAAGLAGGGLRCRAGRRAGAGGGRGGRRGRGRRGPDPRAVDRCLRDLGVRRIPLLVLTHFHADHVAGLPGVLRGRSVGAIQTTGSGEPAGPGRVRTAGARQAGVPVMRAVPESGAVPATLSLGGAVAAAGPAAGGRTAPSVPPPGRRATGPTTPASRCSCALAGLTFLLPGDLEPPAQRGLLARPPGSAPGRCAQGRPPRLAPTRTPPCWSGSAPRGAGQRGRDNPYGHPAPETLRRLSEAGTLVARTDPARSAAR